MASTTQPKSDTLQQLYANLSNTLKTFGAESRQFRYVLEMLRDYVKEREAKGKFLPLPEVENDSSNILVKALADLRLGTNGLTL